MAEIVPFGDCAVPAAGEPVASVVEMLEFALEHARAGRLFGASIALSINDGTEAGLFHTNYWADAGKSTLIYSAVRRLVRRIERDMDGA